MWSTTRLSATAPTPATKAMTAAKVRPKIMLTHHIHPILYTYTCTPQKTHAHTLTYVDIYVYLSLQTPSPSTKISISHSHLHIYLQFVCMDQEPSQTVQDMHTDYVWDWFLTPAGGSQFKWAPPEPKIKPTPRKRSQCSEAGEESLKTIWNKFLKVTKMAGCRFWGAQ